MRLWALSLFIAVACAPAQGQMSLEQQANEEKLQQLQREIELARIQAQTESIRTQTDLLRLQMERHDADMVNQPKEQSLAEVMREDRERNAAEEAAAQVEADREEEAAMASAKSADTVYLGMAMALPVVLGYLIARRKAVGGMMKQEEKFGVMLMIGALLLGLLALSISDNWVPRLDAMQNLMLTLKIRMFSDSEAPSTPMVDVYTKHVLLALLTVAAYGFTTYLGITPAWKKAAATPIATSEPSDPSKEA